jgi:hypothetical protein
MERQPQQTDDTAETTSQMNTLSRLGKLSVTNSGVFVCDIQEKFVPVISHFQSVVHVAKTAVQAAEILKLPILVSEQYPKGLGRTVPEILPSNTSNLIRYEKMKFSMVVPYI